jgi:hypothetical protein
MLRVAFAVSAVVVGLAVTVGARAQKADTPSVAAFRVVHSVVTHPRCMNCHTTVGWPTQGDDRHRHTFNVVRGADGTGAAGMKCATCHQDKNQDAANVPGAKGWHMAALSMGWTGLSPAALCKAMLDPAKNGGRSGEKVIEHMKGDPLVMWAWTPGGKRTVPPVSHQKFYEAAQAWIKLGRHCPAE